VEVEVEVVTPKTVTKIVEVVEQVAIVQDYFQFLVRHIPLQ
jgi:hypothetical protein